MICVLTNNKSNVNSIYIFSVFPEEILHEVEDVDFELFNTDVGSYQTITPAILHIIHTSLVGSFCSIIHTLFTSKEPGLTFAEAAITRAAIKYGGADSVYIHSNVDLENKLVI